jgi:hypothetical protein
LKARRSNLPGCIYVGMYIYGSDKKPLVFRSDFICIEWLSLEGKGLGHKTIFKMFLGVPRYSSALKISPSVCTYVVQSRIFSATKTGYTISFFRNVGDQGCQIFRGTTYQTGGKYTKLQQNLPNGHKIFPMAVK